MKKVLIVAIIAVAGALFWTLWPSNPPKVTIVPAKKVVTSKPVTKAPTPVQAASSSGIPADSNNAFCGPQHVSCAGYTFPAVTLAPTAQKAVPAPTPAETSTPPVFHLGQQQCINGLCITPTSENSTPSPSGPDVQESFTYFTIDVTVSGTVDNNNMPATDCDVAGGSEILVSPNNQEQVVTPNISTDQCGLSGSIQFSILDGTTVYDYSYGNLTWEL